jgi:hypothetical protein
MREPFVMMDRGEPEGARPMVSFFVTTRFIALQAQLYYTARILDHSEARSEAKKDVYSRGGYGNSRGRSSTHHHDRAELASVADPLAILSLTHTPAPKRESPEIQ